MFPPMPRAESSKTREPTAERAVRLREAMGYISSATFANYLGLSPTRWNNVEIGLPLSKDVAFRLVQRVPGLTLDWLYFGRAEGLPLDLARRLGELGGTQSSKTRL